MNASKWWVYRICVLFLDNAVHKTDYPETGRGIPELPNEGKPPRTGGPDGTGL
jgi:hypothetical protein